MGWDSNEIRPPDLIFVNPAPEKSAYDSVVPYKFTPDKSDPVNFAYARFVPLRSTPVNDTFDTSTLGPTKNPPRI